MSTNFKCTNCKHSVGMSDGKLQHRPGKQGNYADVECSCGCVQPANPRWSR